MATISAENALSDANFTIIDPYDSMACWIQGFSEWKEYFLDVIDCAAQNTNQLLKW